MGEMHAKKICSIYSMAMKMGAPVIGLVDCAGLRLQEATDALDGFGKLYLSQAMASGVIPQIMAVFGTCGGGMAVAAGMADFTFMEEKSAQLFVNCLLYTSFHKAFPPFLTPIIPLERFKHNDQRKNFYHYIFVEKNN